MVALKSSVEGTGTDRFSGTVSTVTGSQYGKDPISVGPRESGSVSNGDLDEAKPEAPLLRSTILFISVSAGSDKLWHVLDSLSRWSTKWPFFLEASVPNIRENAMLSRPTSSKDQPSNYGLRRSRCLRPFFYAAFG